MAHPDTAFPCWHPQPGLCNMTVSNPKVCPTLPAGQCTQSQAFFTETPQSLATAYKKAPEEIVQAKDVWWIHPNVLMFWGKPLVVWAVILCQAKWGLKLLFFIRLIFL